MNSDLRWNCDEIELHRASLGARDRHARPGPCAPEADFEAEMAPNLISSHDAEGLGEAAFSRLWTYSFCKRDKCPPVT